MSMLRELNSERYQDPKGYFKRNPDELIVLATDLDEVCFDYLGNIRLGLEAGGLELPPGQASAWDLVEAGWFKAQQEFLDTHAQAVLEGLYSRLAPIPRAKEVLRELTRSGYENNIITSRFVVSGQHARVVSDTAVSLDANEIPYSSLMFQKRKSRFLADAFVDDGPHNVISLREEGQYVIKVNQAYNLELEGPSADNWDEIRELLFERFGR